MIVDQHLYKHPKTRDLARRLKQHPRYASGLLQEVWGWAIDAKPDGMIGDVPTETLVGVFGTVGRDLVEDLRAAYLVCDERCARRGLDPDDHRAGRFHDWQHWAGKLVEGRERERLRGEHRRGRHALQLVQGCPICERRGGDDEQSTGNGGGANRSSTGSRPPVNSQRGGISPADAEHRTAGHPADGHLGTPLNRAQNGTSSSGQTRLGATRPADVTKPSGGITEPNRTEPSQEEPSTPPGRPSAARGTPPAGRVPTPEELRERNEADALEIVTSATGLWQSALMAMRSELTIGNFITWLKGTKLEQRGDTYFVVAPNAFGRDWLREKFAPLVRTTIGALVDDVAPDVRIVIEAEIPVAGGAA